MKKKEKERSHSKLGFTYLETAEVVVSLNQLLANYQVHFHKLQCFHWNVKGRDFFELHELFEKMYKQAFSNIDEIAERVRVFGQTPMSSITEYMDAAQIKEVPDLVNGEAMVNEINTDLEILLSFLMDATDIAARNGDVGTTDLVNSIIKQIEKDHWMLTSWLKSIEVPLHSKPVLS